MRRFRWLSLTAIALLVMGIASGCGSSSDSSGSTEASESGGGGGADVTAAEAAVKKATADITAWTGPESSPPMVKGKSFVVVPCSLAAEGCARQAEGFIDAAETVGWTTKMIDPQGDINKTNAAIEQAITLGADGIFLVSVDPKTVSGTLAEARKDGILVIDAGAGGPQSKPSPTGLNHEVSLHGPEEGEMVANFIIADSDGKANIALINDSEFATVVERVETTKKVIEGCSGCTISQEIDIPVTSVGTTLGSRVKSLLQANPEIDYVWSPYDSAANDIVQAIVEAGEQDSVGVTSFNGNSQNLEYIREGQAQRADVGEALEWAGWAGADDFNRIFHNQEPPANDGVPAKLFIKSNLPAPGEAFEGDFDFRKKYEEIWGIGG
jgi:ribose transport system substrate-binding protein